MAPQDAHWRWKLWGPAHCVAGAMAGAVAGAMAGTMAGAMTGAILRILVPLVTYHFKGNCLARCPVQYFLKNLIGECRFSESGQSDR